MKKIKVAVVASRSEYLNVDANLKHFEEIIANVAKKGVRLVAFPELSLTSYTKNPEILDVAQPIPGDWTIALEKLATKYKVCLSVGLPEKEDDKCYITQVLVSEKGFIGKYRKHHLAQPELGKGFYEGEDIPIFEIDGFKIGINICFDGRHKDTLEALQKQFVDVILHPHGNPMFLGKDAEEWTRGKMVYLVPRAVEARAYILANNSASDLVHTNGTTRFGSGAIFIDPLGQAIARTTAHNRDEQYVIAEIKPLSELIPEREFKQIYPNGERK